MRGVVAAGHHETARACQVLLEAGGNAFDAALAGLCAACVAEPVLASLGGGGFLTAWDGRRAQVFDFFANTPGRRRPEDELDFYEIEADFGSTVQTFHIGAGSIAVPGSVRGLFDIHRTLGRAPIKDVVEPAIRLAREGVEVTSFQSRLLDIVGPIYVATDSVRRVFQNPAGQLLQPGDRLVQRELADTLEILALEGDRLFYEGEMGQLLHEACRSGGHLTMDDLRGYAVAHRSPLEIEHRGARILTNPPPSSGGLLIAFALELLAALPIPEPLSAEHVLDLLWVQEATSRARVEARLHEREPEAHPQALLDPVLLARYRKEVLGRRAAFRGTTHLSVIDAQGRAAALTLSNGEGCGWFLPGTGVMPNNMLGEDDINPHGFNRWPPGTRISSMMAPSLAIWDSGRLLATGSGGSKRIRTALTQVLQNVIDFDQELEPAVSSPRVHLEGRELHVEPGFPESALVRLRDHHPSDHINLWTEPSVFFGGAHTAERFADGRVTGAGDPRRGGTWLLA